MKKRMRKVMALFVVVAMLFNLCPLSATADVRRNNIPASLGNANIQSSNDDKGDKSVTNQGATDAQAKNENKAASDTQAKSENKDTTDTKTKIDKEEDASDSTQIQADTSASEKTDETTAAEKAADNKEASTEAVTDNTEASSTEVINDSEASTTETAVTNDEGKAQSEKDDDKAETKDEKSDKKDDEDKDEKMPAFSETKSVDGVKITVSADKDVFPKGVTLSIRKVSKADGKNVDKAIDKIREDGVNVAAAYTFDIKIVDKDGNEIQPADGKKVRVGFEAEEVGNDNLTADIYHITSKGKKLTAEMLDSDESADKVTASTGGFSLYTVEFTYDEIQYVMEGDTSVALTDILDEVGLIGKVTEVEVSDESLFSAKKKDGEWMVTANKAFSSTEWMKVTIDGVVYEIVVTDDQTIMYNELNVGDFIQPGTTVSFGEEQGRVLFTGIGNEYTFVEKTCSEFKYNSADRNSNEFIIDGVSYNHDTWDGYYNGKCQVVGIEKYCNRLIIKGLKDGDAETVSPLIFKYRKDAESENQTSENDLLPQSVYAGYTNESITVFVPDSITGDKGVVTSWDFYSAEPEEFDGVTYDYLINCLETELKPGGWFNTTLDTAKSYVFVPHWGDYKVVFDTNGVESVSFADAYPDSDGYVTLPTSVGGTYGEYFRFWSTDPYPTSELPSYYQRPNDVSDKIITLYANWYSIRKLKYDANGGTFISSGTDTYEDPKNPYDWTYPTSGSGIATILDGDKLTHPEGKSFKEWNTKADGTGTTYTAGATLDLKGLTYNTVLYAQWESAEPAASVTSGSTTTDYGDFSAAVSAWNSAESGATLKLIANVTTGSTVSVSGTKTLDLNGYGIKMTGSGSVISVTGGASLTLKDSNTDNVTHRFTIADPSEKGAGLATVNDALESGYKTFMGGYITGGSASQGGGVYVAGGTFNMTGGNIIGNKTTAKGYYEGGGVALSNNTDSRFVMTGGTIQYNTSIGRGGGLGIENNATADLSGDAKIMYNRSTDNDWGGGISSFGTLNISGNVKVMYNKGGSAVHPQQGSINVSGSPVIYDNEVSAGNILPDVKINIAGTLAELAKFGIYYGNAGVFTTGDNAADYASNFVSDNDNFVVGKNADGQLYLGVPVAVSFNTNDGSTVESQTVASGSMVTKPDDPTKEGYAFVGWYKESTFTTEWDFDRDTVTEDTTIYAKWKQAYSVTLTGGANSSASPSDKTTQTGLTGAMTTVTYTANDGYYFGELTTVLSRNGITVTRADDGKTITVSGTPTADVNITIPDAVAMRTYVVTLSIGYNYENYTVSGGALSQTVSGAIEPVTFTANDGYYFLTEYTTHTHNGLTAKVDEDSVVSFLNTPDGYTTSTVITVSGTPTSDVSWIVASKPVPGYTVTINGGGNATPSGETTYSLMSGNLPTVIYTPNEGYHFERFDDIVKDDIKVTWSSEQEVAVFGYVGSDVEITVPDAISNDAGKVTFKVKNGSWDDGNEADIEVDLENSRISADKIPTVGSKPAEGYKAGSWDTEPSTDTAITADTTYTYTYIKKTSITPTVSISDWTYGGTASTPSVNGNTGNGEVTYTYAKKGTTAFSSDVPSDVGEYTVKAVVAETDNYLGGEATADFTIVKAEVTAPAITEKHYTGKTQTADVEASDLYTVTTNNGGTDVGSYDVVLTLKDAVNYRWADDEAATKLLTFKIVSADTNTVTVSIDGWTYGDSAKTPTVTADFGADTAAYTYSSSENGEYSTDVPTDAGTWYVKASIPETENYPAGEAKTSFTIAKAEVTAPTITDKHYTGEAQTADVEASDLYTVTTNNGGTKVGSYDVVLTLKDTTNYKWTDSEVATKTLTFKIVPKDANIVTVSIEGWMFGEAAKTPTVTADFGADTAAYTYSSSENGEYSDAVPTDAGTWYVKASVAETEDYPAGEDITSFVIAKAKVTSPTIANKNYTGDKQTADVETSDLYTVTTNNGGTDVGDYDVVLTLKDAVNYKWTDSEEAAKTLTFKIVTATANNVTVDIEGWTYGEAAKTPTATADFGADTATYTYSSLENGDYSADVPTDAGTWYVKAGVVATDNYPAGEAKTSFVISKAEVTAPAITEKHYTGKAQTADVEASDLYTVTTNNGGTDVGSYDVVLTLKDAVNYKWTDSEDAAKTLTFKIVPEDTNIVTVNIDGWTYGEDAKAPKVTADFGADTATYTYSSSENGEYSADVPTDAGTWYVKANIEATDDYSAGEAKNSFVIEPAAITIMADDKSTIYNEELAELTYTIGGSYVEDDDLGITLSTTAAKGSEPGDYLITVSWKENPNYDAALEDGQYTITKGGVSITVSGYSGKYDGKAHGITVKELEGESGELIGIFDGDSPEATVYYSTKELGKDNYKDDGSKELLTFTDAGKYTVYYYVQCKGYTIDPISGSKTVEITKVPLKVTAKDATITYGDKPDNNGVEYSGFVNDETKKVLKGTLSYNIDYEQYGDVGSSYSITPKGVTAKNYDITFVSGKLKVNPKKLTFTWDDADKTYNGKKQSVTAKANTINDDVLTLTYSDNEKKNAGKYTAKITGVEGQKATNYTLADDESTASYEWEIAKKKMSVTAKDVSVEYDEKEHGIEVKVTDPKSGYTITYGKEKGEYDSRKSPAITKEGSLTVYFKVEADNYITYTGSAKVTVKEKKEGTSSSSVEVKEGTPSVSVNGLDEEAKALQEGESADVNVTMSVEQVAEGSEGGDGITAIRNIAEGRMLTFFDIKVIKDVDSVKTVMDTTTNILEICIPYYHISEEGLAAYRYHGSAATRLTESDSRQDGTYRVDKITKKVYIYTNQFSIYAIGYTVKSSVNEEGDTVYDISGNIRYEGIDGMANLILYRNGEECKRGIAAFTGGVGTYQFEELKEGNYSLRITMDAGKDSFTLEIPIGDVSKQVVE